MHVLHCSKVHIFYEGHINLRKILSDVKWNWEIYSNFKFSEYMNFNRTFKQWLWLYWWMHTELFYQWPKSSNFLLDAFQITICSMHPKEIFLNMANFEANWIIFINLTNQFSVIFFIFVLSCKYLLKYLPNLHKISQILNDKKKL